MPLLLLVFTGLFPAFALATTQAEGSRERQLGLCQLRGFFQSVTHDAVPYRRKGRAEVLQKIFWQVKVKDRSSSDPAVCPTAESASLRIRGASFRAENGRNVIDYPVHLQEPGMGTEATFTVLPVSGRDSLTGENYSEWLLREVTP